MCKVINNSQWYTIFRSHDFVILFSNVKRNLKHLNGFISLNKISCGGEINVTYLLWYFVIFQIKLVNWVLDFFCIFMFFFYLFVFYLFWLFFCNDPFYRKWNYVENWYPQCFLISTKQIRIKFKVWFPFCTCVLLFLCQIVKEFKKC